MGEAKPHEELSPFMPLPYCYEALSNPVLAVNTMKKVQLKAKSSSGEPYDVTFTNTGTSLSVFCTCQAGIYGKLCKHKTQLLSGDASILHDPRDAPALREICQWVSDSEYETILTQYGVLKKEIKKEIEAAKRREQKYRKTIERALRQGIPLKGGDP